MKTTDETVDDKKTKQSVKSSNCFVLVLPLGIEPGTAP